MTALAIMEGLTEFVLVIGEPYGNDHLGRPCYAHRWDASVSVRVPKRDVSSRPDPIRRAWAAVEAKRGMACG